MTRMGRCVAAMGSVVLGLVAVAVFQLGLSAIAPGTWWLVGSLVVFGLTVGACHTWTVDGRFVRSRG